VRASSFPWAEWPRCSAAGLHHLTGVCSWSVGHCATVDHRSANRSCVPKWPRRNQFSSSVVRSSNVEAETSLVVHDRPGSPGGIFGPLCHCKLPASHITAAAGLRVSVSTASESSPNLSWRSSLTAVGHGECIGSDDERRRRRAPRRRRSVRSMRTRRRRRSLPRPKLPQSRCGIP